MHKQEGNEAYCEKNIKKALRTAVGDLSRAKSMLHNIYTYICQLKVYTTLMPAYDTCFQHLDKPAWKTKVSVRWPHELEFEGQAETKSRCESVAAAALVEYLVRNGHIDRTLSPRSCTDSHMDRESRLLKSRRNAPVPMALPADCVIDMRDVVDRFGDFQIFDPKLSEAPQSSPKQPVTAPQVSTTSPVLYSKARSTAVPEACNLWDELSTAIEDQVAWL